MKKMICSSLFFCLSMLLANTQISMEMIKIPAGSFIRDSKVITIDAYEIGKYEVTIKQFREFLSETEPNSKFFNDRYVCRRLID